MRYDVAVAGDLYRDIIMSGFSSLPHLGEECFANDLREAIGGGAAITACGLAKLGLSVAVAGMVGQHDHSVIARDLASQGVETSLLQGHPTEPSGITVAVSTAEDRAFLTYAGANRALSAFLRASETFEALSSARHIHLACAPDPLTARELAARLRGAGCTTSLDSGWHENWLSDPESRALLREMDVFFPNEREAKRITQKSEPEDMLNGLEEMGVRHVALKLGARGAVSRVAGVQYEAAPVPMNALDTTGAGDAFDAGYLYGFVRGCPPGECLRIGNLCGALSTRELGGIAGLATRDEIAAVEELSR